MDYEKGLVVLWDTGLVGREGESRADGAIPISDKYVWCLLMMKVRITSSSGSWIGLLTL